MPQYSGWVYIRMGKDPKKEKKRWIEINKGDLYVHKRKKDEPQIVSLEESGNEGIEMISIQGKDYILLDLLGENIYLRSSKEIETKEWMQQIKSNIDYLKRKEWISKQLKWSDFDVMASTNNHVIYHYRYTGSINDISRDCYQVRKIDSGRLYFMKILSKSLNEKQYNLLRWELQLLKSVDHPFLAKLVFSFQSSHNLHFVIDWINGGNLFEILMKEKTFSADRALFYASEIALALEYLHNNDIQLFKLGTDQILLDAEGHVILSKFGCHKDMPLECTDIPDGMYTLEYLAPEILKGEATIYGTDWWSYGIILYEMLFGIPPFWSQNVQELYLSIMNDQVSFPASFNDQNCKDLISSLLNKDPKNRLSDPHLIKSHPYFSSIDWSKVLNKQYQPPFVPILEERESDTKHMKFSYDYEGEGFIDLVSEYGTKFDDFVYSRVQH